MTVSIEGLNPADVLAKLVNNGYQANGAGGPWNPSERMTRQEAQKTLDQSLDGYVDYSWGRCIKIQFGVNELDTQSYDHYNHRYTLTSACEAIADLRMNNHVERIGTSRNRRKKKGAKKRRLNASRRRNSFDRQLARALYVGD